MMSKEIIDSLAEEAYPFKDVIVPALNARLYNDLIKTAYKKGINKGLQLTVNLQPKETANDKYLSSFDAFRKLYPGTKRGNKTEFDNFCKKHKDWKEVLPYLVIVIREQFAVKEVKKLKKEFIPEWKNLQTWINQRCWEEEIAKTDSVKPNVMKGSFL